MLTLTTEEFKLFGELIERESGISLQEEKMYLVEARLRSMVTEQSCRNYTELYQKATSILGKELKMQIVDAMTTNETLWFRDDSPYKALIEHIFPQYADAMRTGRKAQLKIWSAACSTGQEPYSISIMAHEFGDLNGFPAFANAVSIRATDISPSVLEMARQGNYSGLHMSRGMRPELQQKYFTQNGTIWTPKPSVRKLVDFHHFNLQSSFSSIGKYDIVFLRNVAIYFSSSFKQELFNKIASILNPGGYLFLGTSESLLSYKQSFSQREYGRCAYYQLE